MNRRETHQEFQQRMDRARAESAAEANKGAIFGVGIYAIGLAAYFYLKSGEWHGVYFLFAGVNLLLFAVAVGLLIGTYRSRRP